MKKKRIAEIAIEIKTGKTPPTSRQEYFGDEINWYTPTDLDRQKNLSVSTRGLTQLAIDDKKAVLFKPNTVLIGCIGDIGKIGIAKSIASSNQQITGVLTDGNEIYPDYFYYWLKINKRILQNASTNAVVPILNNKQLGDIKISYHDYLTDQIKIAQVLTQAEKLIAQRKESIALLDEYLKSTFLEMFGDYKLMSNSKLDTLGNNISYLTSGSRGWAQYYSNSGAKFLRIQNIGGGTIRTDNLISVNPPESAERLRTRVMEGDLLISITADIGRTSVVPKDFGEAYINQHLALIRLNKNINPVYAAYFYNMPFGNNAIQKKNRAAVKAGLNFKDINSFPIFIPPLPLQNQFAQIVEKTEALKSKYQRSLQELEQLFGSLSQRAFKGELDLSRIEVSEAAYQPSEPPPVPTVPQPEKIKKERPQVAVKADAATSIWLINQKKGKRGKIPFNPAEGNAVLSTEFAKKDKGFHFQAFEAFLKEEGFDYEFEHVKDFLFEKLEHRELLQYYADEVWMEEQSRAEIGSEQDDFSGNGRIWLVANKKVKP